MMPSGPGTKALEAKHEVDLSAQQQKGLERKKWFQTLGSAYAREHATRTATIGFALASSPIALLAWIGEKFFEWTDEDPTMEEIVRSVSLYWLTDTIQRCLFPYREVSTRINSILLLIRCQQLSGLGKELDTPLPTPYGFSWFPQELMPQTKAFLETRGDLVFFRAHDRVSYQCLGSCFSISNSIREVISQRWKTPRFFFKM
jgi:microsomal epoxide hydrolase